MAAYRSMSAFDPDEPPPPSRTGLTGDVAALELPSGDDDGAPSSSAAASSSTAPPTYAPLKRPRDDDDDEVELIEPLVEEAEGFRLQHSPTSVTRYRGVDLRLGLFRAVWHDGELLGHFETVVEAAVAFARRAQLDGGEHSGDEAEAAAYRSLAADAEADAEAEPSVADTDEEWEGEGEDSEHSDDSDWSDTSDSRRKAAAARAAAA